MCVVDLWASVLVSLKAWAVQKGFCVYSKVSINGCGYMYVTHSVFESGSACVMVYVCTYMYTLFFSSAYVMYDVIKLLMPVRVENHMLGDNSVAKEYPGVLYTVQTI